LSFVLSPSSGVNFTITFFPEFRAGRTGLEPATTGFGDRDSTN
jgi:hypothetical protein